MSEEPRNTSEPIQRVFHDGWADVSADEVVEGWAAIERTYGTLTSTEMCALLTSHVLGRILTAVDMLPTSAVIGGGNPKAVKDTIKNLMWDTYLHVHHWMANNAHNGGNVPFPFPWDESKVVARPPR